MARARRAPRCEREVSDVPLFRHSRPFLASARWSRRPVPKRSSSVSHRAPTGAQLLRPLITQSCTLAPRRRAPESQRPASTSTAMTITAAISCRPEPSPEPPLPCANAAPELSSSSTSTLIADAARQSPHSPVSAARNGVRRRAGTPHAGASLRRSPPVQIVFLAVLLTCVALGPVIAADGDHSASAVFAARTGKERLSDKGSDEQRRDDCKVPQARRGRARPTACPWDVGS